MKKIHQQGVFMNITLNDIHNLGRDVQGKIQGGGITILDIADIENLNELKLSLEDIKESIQIISQQLNPEKTKFSFFKKKEINREQARQSLYDFTEVLYKYKKELEQRIKSYNILIAKNTDIYNDIQSILVIGIKWMTTLKAKSDWFLLGNLEDKIKNLELSKEIILQVQTRLQHMQVENLKTLQNIDDIIHTNIPLLENIILPV